MSVVRVSTQAPIVITAFHKDVATIAISGMRAGETMAKKMQALITSRYGAAAPAFEAYKADLKALDELAIERKLASGQWLRRPYCAALKVLFKDLPVSQAPDAIAKRLQRETAQAQVAAALKAAKAPPAPIGAPVGQTQDRAPSPAEQMEQVIAKIGVFEALYACLRILDSDDSTKAQAVHMRKMADKAHDARHDAKAKAAKEPAAA